MDSLPAFSFSTTAEEVASALAEDINGKNVLVTGTSINGIGFETARVLAKYAKMVVITGHNPERLKLAEDAIQQEQPSAYVRPLLVDLSSLASIRNAAAEFNADPDPLHVLIHNAAGMMRPLKLTEENLESQMATNHFGPFLLTKLLMPKMLAAGTALYTPRVIFVSSIVNGFISSINFDTFVRPDPGIYQPFDAYCQSKIANVLMGIELSKRSGGRIRAYSLHPGGIYTNIMLQKETILAMQKIGCLGQDGLPSHEIYKWKTIPQGAATTLVAAFDPRLGDKAGAYLVDCNVENGALSPWCIDPANADKLWNLTESILGESFQF